MRNKLKQTDNFLKKVQIYLFFTVRPLLCGLFNFVYFAINIKNAYKNLKNEKIKRIL